MIPFLVALVAVAPASARQDAEVRAVGTPGGVRAEFLYKEKVVAVTDGSLGFESAATTATGIALTGKTFSAKIDVIGQNGVFSVAVSATGASNSLRSALFNVSLAPGRDEATSVQAFPKAPVLTVDRMASPFSTVAGGGYGIAILPDVDDIEAGKPMSPIIKRTGATLGYGFAPYRRDDNWNPVLMDRSLNNPAQFSWKFDLVATTETLLVDAVNDRVWTRDGKERAIKPLPQTIPFRYYTKPTYDMETGGGQPGLWWVSESKTMRAPLSADGQAKLTVDENLVRFAWGMRWWADHLQQLHWAEQADQVINLVLSAPRKSGMTPIAFDTATNSWRFESFDASATAHTARQLLHYAESFSHPSEPAIVAEVERAIRALDGAEGLTMVLLKEASTSPALSEAIKSFARDQITARQARAVALAQTYLRQNASPSAESIAMLLYLSRQGESDLAASLTRNAFLHQAVWRPSTYSGTEVFGAFVGDHLIEEKQSVYSADLFEAVMALGLEQYADRSVAALRAPLALFRHSTHNVSGMHLPPYIKQFRSSPWFGRDGRSEFGEWRGIAEGVGQTLASMARVTDTYGSFYTHKEGWSVGIDGIIVVDDVPYSAFAFNPFTFEGVFPYDHVDASTDDRTAGRDPESYPGMRALKLEYTESGVNLVALPGFTVIDAPNRLSGTFTFGDGSTRTAEFLPTGFGTRVENADLLKGPVSFRGTLDKTALKLDAMHFVIGPPALDAIGPRGWRRLDGLADIARSSTSGLSTSDDGMDGTEKALTGRIESIPFLLTANVLKFSVAGEADAGLYVELIDALTGVPIASLQKQGPGVEDYVWEVFEQLGRSVVFRIVDESKTGSIELRSLVAAEG